MGYFDHGRPARLLLLIQRPAIIMWLRAHLGSVFGFAETLPMQIPGLDSSCLAIAALACRCCSLSTLWIQPSRRPCRSIGSVAHSLHRGDGFTGA